LQCCSRTTRKGKEKNVREKVGNSILHFRTKREEEGEE
jgi:hypothetical protein